MSNLPLLYQQAELLGAVIEGYLPSNNTWVNHHLVISARNAKYRVLPGQEAILEQALKIAQQHFKRITLANSPSENAVYLINAAYAKHGAKFHLAGSGGQVIELNDTVPALYQYSTPWYDFPTPEQQAYALTLPHAFWHQYWGGTPEQLSTIPPYTAAT